MGFNQAPCQGPTIFTLYVVKNKTMRRNGSCFNGRPLNPPACEPVGVFDVVAEDGTVALELD